MDAVDERVTALLAGPRGRRLCFELGRWAADGAGLGERWSRWRGSLGGPDRDVPGDLSAAVAAVDVGAVAEIRDPAALLPAMADAVEWGMYWQEPDAVDAALRDGVLAGLLAPLAGAVLASPASTWWTAPVVREDQWQLRRWLAAPDAGAPAAVGTGELLGRWRRAAVAEEELAGRERPVDPTAMISGTWWSTPLHWGSSGSGQLVSTTPTAPGTDGLPTGLVLVEDSAGGQRVEARPVRVDPAARVYELTGPAAWVELAVTYPLPVTNSRRHDWFRATGWRGEWVIPDWAAVARDWDGVHLTVDGYLSTAGRLLHLPGTGSACTLLAGWDPAATWWLADVTHPGPPVVWTTPGQHPLDWTRAD